MNIKSTEFFISSDLSLATTASLFFPIVDIDKTNPRKAEFVFKRTQKLDDFIDSYWEKELRVEPQAYFSQLKAIKTRLYGER